MPTGSTIYMPFMPADRVHIDGHKDLVATVTGLYFNGTSVLLVSVEWWNNGTLQTARIEDYRLEAAVDQ